MGGKGGSGGWLTTKKTGRDDARIAKDKKKALEARRKQRQLPKPAAGGTKRAGRRRRVSSPSTDDDDDDDDDDSSMEDFIVGDDEEESDDQISEASEEEEEVAMLEGRNRKPPPRKRLLGSNKEETATRGNSSGGVVTLSVEDDDSSSDDGNEDSFLLNHKSFPKRTSKPAPHMQQRKRPAAQTKKQKSNAVNSLEKKNPFKAFAAPEASNKKRPSQKLQGGMLGDLGGGSGQENNHAEQSAEKPVAAKKSKRQILDDSDDDDDSIPPPFAAIKASAASNVAGPKKRRRVIAEDHTPPSFQRKKPATSSSLAGLMMDNASDDEDEQLALALAMSQSVEDMKKKTKKEEPLEEPEFKEFDEKSSSSDEENDGGDESQDFEDKDARTAASVLATANNLSTQLLRTMQAWSQGDSNDDSKGGAPVMGMIVDGALALADLDGSRQRQDHDWISQDTMRRICPKVTLASYQLIGVNWMALLHGMQVQVEADSGSKQKKKTTNVNGVLADEMGLGKTVQTITFLAWLKYKRFGECGEQAKPKGSDEAETKAADGVVDLMESDNEVVDSDEDEVGGAPSKTAGVADGYVHPHLVVAPSSVLSNWEREFEKFAPHLNVVKYHGTMAEREQLQEDLRLHLPKNCASRKRARLQPLDVILTPVTYFQKEKSDDRNFLRRFKFDYMVVDEAHLLKNSKGLRYITLDRFDTRYRLLLTGTPVQNSPQELMSLLCFLMPLFSRKQGFDENGDENRNDGGQSMLQHFVSLEASDSNGKVDDAVAYEKLKQLFAPFVLRRRKQDVLKQIMPPKERKVEFVDLDPASRTVYNNIMSNHLAAKKQGTNSNKRSDHVFTQLRKAAHHPLLLRTRHTSPKEAQRLAKAFLQYGAFRGEGCTLDRVKEECEKMNDFEIHLTALELIENNERRRKALSPYVLQEDDLFSSAKFVRLRTLLPQLIADGHRILIFSIWTSCLDLLSCLLEQMDIRYLRMQGSTAVNERQGLIDEFSIHDTSIPIFLLSTKACGLGINLTAADVCIMHDIDFNPFNDLQAEDRVHRIGQKKKTLVIKMVTTDTVDADIYEMQQRKARMNAAIMDSNAAGAGDKDEWTGKKAKAAQDQVFKTAMDRFLTQAHATDDDLKAEMTKQAENDVVEIDDSSDSDSKPVAKPTKAKSASPEKEDI